MNREQRKYGIWLAIIFVIAAGNYIAVTSGLIALKSTRFLNIAIPLAIGALLIWRTAKTDQRRRAVKED